MENTGWAKTLRIIGIVAMSLTAVVTLAGGAGTTCVALNPTGYGDRFAGIAPFQWLYLAFVVVTIALGVLGVRAGVLLARGARSAYRDALIALLGGALVGIIHIVASRSLRGGSMPVDAVVYVTVVTLAIFLLFRIPGIWQGVNFAQAARDKGTGRHAAAIALWATGLLALTIQFPMAPTHTIDGVNYADVWHVALTLIGAALILSGVATEVYARYAAGRKAAGKASSSPSAGIETCSRHPA